MKETFDLSALFAKGLSGESYAQQKVGVKLPFNAETGDETDAAGFAALIAALTRLPDEQLDHALGPLGWATMQGHSRERVPVIDLPPIEGLGSRGPALNDAKLPGETLERIVMRAVDAKVDVVRPVADDGRAMGTIGVQGGDLRGAGDEKSVWAPRAMSAQLLSDQGTRANEGGVAVHMAKPNPAAVAALEDVLAQDPPAREKGKARTVQMPPVPHHAPGEAAPDSERKGFHSPGLNKAVLEKPLSPLVNRSNHAHVDVPRTVDDPMADNPKPDSAREGVVSRNIALGKTEGGAAQQAPAGASGAAGLNATQHAVAPGEGMPADGRGNGVEAKPLKQADRGPDTPSAGREIQNDVMRQIVQRMTLRTEGRQSLMNIRLKPEFLGNLRMQVVTENHQVTIRMAAANNVVKQIIEQNIHVLRAELQQHGLQVHKLDVFVARDDADPWHNGRQPTPSRQSRHEGQGGRQRGRHAGASENPGASAEAGTARNPYAIFGDVDFFV